jgi:plastocyanin
MTDANEGVSRRAFLFGSAGAAAAGAAGAAAAQEGNTTAGGNASAGNASAGGTNASADTNASAGNASAGGNTSSGNATGGNSSGGNASGGNASGGNASSGGGSSGGMSKTVEVGAGDSGLKFDPEEVEVTPGSTIKWTWLNDGHNIVVESQPEGANWEGTSGGEGKLYDEGYEYTHTFETEGSYEYFCAPHKSAGMVGTVKVSEDAGSGGGGGAGGGPPEVPDSAKSLGVASTFLMFATLGLSYFFLKYGGDYGAAEGD